MNRLPVLRIELAKGGELLRIVDLHGGEHIVPCRLAGPSVSDYSAALRLTLESMKDRTRRGALTISDASDALRELNTRGLSLMVEIFKGDRGRVVEIFQQSFKSWSVATEPVVITTASADLSSFLPLEFLPIFEMSSWPPCPDIETLIEAARRFGGFSTVIKREFQNLPLMQDLTLKKAPKLRMKCFVDNSLGGVVNEVGFFEDNSDDIDLDGPWPLKRIPQFATALAVYLQDATVSFVPDVHSLDDQIHHFICHCEINPNVSSESFLRMSQNNRVTIAELQAEVAPRVSKDWRPLVFLNACGTSRIDPMAATSFPRFFLEDNRNRGFIGTETNIPDRFAATFASSFYTGLLKGLTLGEAMYEAKWKMLRDGNNPLGILYTTYADPELRLSA